MKYHIKQLEHVIHQLAQDDAANRRSSADRGDSRRYCHKWRTTQLLVSYVSTGQFSILWNSICFVTWRRRLLSTRRDHEDRILDHDESRDLMTNDDHLCNSATCSRCLATSLWSIICKSWHDVQGHRRWNTSIESHPTSLAFYFFANCVLKKSAPHPDPLSCSRCMWHGLDGCRIRWSIDREE